MKIVEFAKGVDQVELAHNEPPHPELHRLPSSAGIPVMVYLVLNIFKNFRRPDAKV